MSDHVGILDLSSLRDEAPLKQAALAFDRLVLPGAGALAWLRDSVPGDIPEKAESMIATYEFLVGRDVVVPTAAGSVHSSFEGHEERDVITVAFTEETLQPLRQQIFEGYKNASPEAWAALVREATERSLRRTAVYYRERFGWDAVAVMPDAQSASRVLTGNEHVVIDVLLEHIPVPDDETSWEAILDFRTNPEVRRKYFLLRDWLNEVARAKLTSVELHDRLRALMADYEHHMHVAKIKIHHGIARTVLTVAAEALEGVLRLKPTKIVDAFFTVRKRRIDLSEAEQSAPGREIAYILNARERFM